MNIFVLSQSPMMAAQYHCDKHVVKMILETAQLLSTADHEWDNVDQFEKTYKPTHINHPCAVWTRTSLENYQWLCELGVALCNEYTYRYAKHRDSPGPKHVCDDMIQQRLDWVYYKHGGLNCPTKWVLAMPDEYKTENVVESYRNYYRGAKREIATYTRRTQPEWMK